MHPSHVCINFAIDKQIIHNKKSNNMKQFIISIAAVIMAVLPAKAQRLGNISFEAQYITDKMMLELGMADNLRGSILRLNMNYLNGINSYRDIDSKLWKTRNTELKRLMSKQQWKKYRDAYYFYRPIGWRDNAYVHNIYAKYPKNYGKRKQLDKRRNESKWKGGKRKEQHKRDWDKRKFGSRR